MECPACGKRDVSRQLSVRDHFSRKAFRVRICLKCGCGYVSDPPLRADLPGYYDNASGAAMASRSNFVFEHLRRLQFERELRQVSAILSQGSFIADLGAGDGTFLEFLAKKGYACLAVDQSRPASWPSSVEHVASSLHGADFSAEILLRQGRVPDLVVMRHSLEHILEPCELLSKLFSAGVGAVWIEVPNIDALFSRLLGEYQYYWDPPRHLCFFSERSLREMARRSGYRVANTRFFGIDEIVTSAYRVALLMGASPEGAASRLLAPKGILAAVSSSVAAVLGFRAVAAMLLVGKD